MPKRRIKKHRSRFKRQDRIEILNNGQLVYTYDEAEKRRITRPAFVRALDDLIEHGFLEITQSGAGMFRSTTFYALAERWKVWGTDAFVAKPRPKRKGQMGFRKGHPPYYTARQQEKGRILSSNENVTGSSNADVTGEEKANNDPITESQR